MRGTAYAIGEIIVFLVLAGLIGFAIGVVLAWGRGKSSAGPAEAAPAETGDAERESRLEARVAELEAKLAETGDAGARVEALQKELSVAQWQIDALEEELAKRAPSTGSPPAGA